MKVFGVGYNKTGTTTLGVCLRTFGLSHRSHDLDLVRAWRDGRISDIVDAAADVDCVEDWPWPLVFRELDEAFPGSKFVLTTRRPTAWRRTFADNLWPLEANALAGIEGDVLRLFETQGCGASLATESQATPAEVRRYMKDVGARQEARLIWDRIKERALFWR